MGYVWRSPGKEHELMVYQIQARAPGISGEIRRAIMGHADRLGSVHERYGPKVMKEYLEAVDVMQFDHSEDQAG